MAKDVFGTTADYLENQGLILAALADKSKNVAQKAALYREAAHYFECVVRLRGGSVFPLSLKKQRTARKTYVRRLAQNNR